MKNEAKKVQSISQDQNDDVTVVSEPCTSQARPELKLSTPGKKRKQSSKKIELDNFDQCALRNLVNSFYTVRKEIPTLKKILTAAKADLNFPDKAANAEGFLTPLDYVSDQASENSSVKSTISIIKIRNKDVPRSDELFCDSEYESEDNCQELSKLTSTGTRENVTQKKIKEDSCNKYQMSKQVDVEKVKLLGDVQWNVVPSKPDACLDVSGLSSFLNISGLTDNIPISGSDVPGILREIESEDYYQINQTETNFEEKDFSPSDESDFDPNSVYMSDDDIVRILLKSTCLK
ncbi:unnamed protein product [Parnassius apollo]|uniref:(apollo) hypothetical protein n=1 Tax=Parnassius apollo TaxID=110799 RepID=A0A8S3WME3_PARAO|nr:unnamed protein product [Parnassius apollo]